MTILRDNQGNEVKPDFYRGDSKFLISVYKEAGKLHYAVYGTAQTAELSQISAGSFQKVDIKRYGPKEETERMFIERQAIKQAASKAKNLKDRLAESRKVDPSKLDRPITV